MCIFTGTVGGIEMLYDIIVAVIILLGGVAIYFALLGMIVLYNKFSANGITSQTQPNVQDENTMRPHPPGIRENKFQGRVLKSKIRLGTPCIPKPNLPVFRLNKPHRPENKNSVSADLLGQEHKKHEEEFRRKMQQRDEEFMRELKQRQEEKRLAREQEITVDHPNNTEITEQTDL